MRWAEVSLLLMVVLGLSGCAVPLASQQAPPRLTTGFWFWNLQAGSSEAVSSGEPLDVLFVHVGSIDKNGGQWRAYGQLPDDLPAAREYWFVFRFEKQSVPDLLAAPALVQEVSRLQAVARRRHLNIAGVQLDIDSPTGALAQYANILREVRKGLPSGCEISITALLDWFRSGTAIDGVIAQVDEFVPQFYDVSDRNDYGGGSAIAASIDATRWGPVFNRFGKRFRVGISTFGRARVVPEGARYFRGAFYGDVAPIDIATNPAFELQTSRNQANELVLNYRATRKVYVGYNDFDSGKTIQFTLATPESVRTAVESARQMGGHLAGVVFFRWAGSDETLALQPDEVLRAAGLPSQGRRRQNRIDVIDGHCAAVECVDVYLNSTDPFAAKTKRYRIHTSTELEYFLPEKTVPVRMTGPTQLELSLPPYCARGRLYLGRAVTMKRSEFKVQEEQ